MPDRYDVIVAGAGPAGSATARDAAAAGLRVLLLEHHRTVGRPLQCSGFVSPRTLELARVAVDDVVINTLTGARVRTRNAAEVHLGGGRVYAYAIDRVRFDQLLAAQAEAAGAELRTGVRLLDFERGCGAARVRIDDRGTTRTIEAPLLVGADGVHSTVARVLGRSHRGTVVRALGVELPIPPQQPATVELIVDRQWLPGWFAWSIPLDARRTRIGVGTTDAVPPARLLAALRALFPTQFDAEPLPGTFSAGLIPLWQPAPLVYDRVMLVGDAAGQVKPSTGGGIHSGLVGAHHAARQAVAATECGTFDAAALRGYERRWLAEMGGEFRNLNRLRSAYVRLGQRQLDTLLGVLGRPALQRIIADQGDIDFPSHMFASLVRSTPRLLAVAGGGWLRPLRRAFEHELRRAGPAPGTPAAPGREPRRRRGNASA